MANEQVIENGVIINNGAVRVNLPESVSVLNGSINAATEIDVGSRFLRVFSKNGAVYHEIFYIDKGINGDISLNINSYSTVAPENTLNIALNDGGNRATKKFMYMHYDGDDLISIFNEGSVVIGGNGGFDHRLVIAGDSGNYNDSSDIDVGIGGLELFLRSSASYFLMTKTQGLNHGAITFLPTNVVFGMEALNNYGTKLKSFGDNPFIFEALRDAPNGNPGVLFDIKDLNTGVIVDTPDEFISFEISNNGTELSRLYADATLALGSTYSKGKLSIGGGSSANIDVGDSGIELRQGELTDSFFITKSLTLSHSYTGLSNNKIFFEMKKVSETSGGTGGGVEITSLNSELNKDALLFTTVHNMSGTTVSSNLANEPRIIKSAVNFLIKDNNGNNSEDKASLFTIQNQPKRVYSDMLPILNRYSSQFITISGDISLNQYQRFDIKNIYTTQTYGVNNYTNSDDSFMSSYTDTFRIARISTDTYNNRALTGGVLLSAYNGGADNVFKFHGRVNSDNSNSAVFSFYADRADSVNNNDTYLIKNSIIYKVEYKYDSGNNNMLMGIAGLGNNGEYVYDMTSIGKNTIIQNSGTTSIFNQVVHPKGDPNIFISTMGTEPTLPEHYNYGIVGFTTNLIPGSPGIMQSYITRNGGFWSLNSSKASIYLGHDATVLDLKYPLSDHVKLNGASAGITLSDSGNIIAGYINDLMPDRYSFFNVSKYSSTGGGVTINTINSDNTMLGSLYFKVISKGVDENDSKNDSNDFYAPIMFDVARTPGGSGTLKDTTYAFHGAGNLLILRNGDASETSNLRKEVFIIKGSGKHIINVHGASDNNMEFRTYIDNGGNPHINHGLNSLNSKPIKTDTFGVIGAYDILSGGMVISGITELPGIALTIEGIVSSSSASSIGGVVINSSYNNLGVISSIGNNQTLLTVSNKDVEKFSIRGDGAIRTRGHNNGNATNYLLGGGISLHGYDSVNTGYQDRKYLILSDYYVAHGKANVDTSTFFDVGKIYYYTGGALLRGFTDDDSSTAVNNEVAFEIQGTIQKSTALTTTTSTASKGVIHMQATKNNGNTVIGTNENILTVGTSVSTTEYTKMVLKGSGALYLDSTLTQNAYDDQDDIKLAETARFMLAGWDDKVLSESKQQLENLGIMDNGFMNVQKMQALHLGTMGQLWNMIRNMGKELGYDESKLLQMAKEY